MLNRLSKLALVLNNVNFRPKRSFNLKINPLYCDKFTKYEPFSDHRATVVFDVEEERRRSKVIEETSIVEDVHTKFIGIPKIRGVEGVIEIEELCKILQNQNAVNIFVAKVPPEYRYVNYIVVVSGKSTRHMIGMMEFVKQVFKYKMDKSDIVPKIEGKNSRDWIAIDLGNVALHIFSQEKRLEYDLESLWSLGSDFDKISKEPDNAIISLIKNYSNIA